MASGRRLFGSVRAKAALGATAVVALALVTAGTAVLLVLRSNLHDQAGLQAELQAREVATELAAGTAVSSLDLSDDQPVLVLDARDRARAASDGLERFSGPVEPSGGAAPRPTDSTTTPAPAPTQTQTPSRPSPSPRHGDGEEDADDDGDEGDSDADSDADSDGDGDGDGEEDDPGTVAPRQGEVAEDAVYGDGRAVISGESGAYRFAGLQVRTPADEVFTVWSGVPLETEQSAVSTVGRAMLIGLFPLLAVVAAVTWLVTRRALRPVEGIRSEMAAITASTDLSRRVPEPGTHDEIARLARTTNETLTALDEAVERQRRFVADASHELRSPIASLRTELEVAAAHPELLDLEGAVEDTVRLQRLAADLLLLARLDAGEEPQRGRVPLGALVREELARRGGNGGGGGSGGGAAVVPEAGPVEDLTVRGSRGQLERVLGNLIDNAVRHAASRVTVSVRGDGPWGLLEVADDGGGVAPQDRERIFERFVRLDDARSRDDGGAGLGLAIVRDVVERHGGSIAVTGAPGGGALFTVRLPLDAPR